MSSHRTLKSIHLAGTAWFILCVGYILAFALRRAGVNWWVIFSLSGHSVLIVFLLISLYLFAMFRGVTQSQAIEIEHPLTSTDYYTVLYITTPFLGGLAGCLGMIGVSAIKQFLLGVALGTLGATFLVWVIVDPVAGLLEMLLPLILGVSKHLRLSVRMRETLNRTRFFSIAKVLTLLKASNKMKYLPNDSNIF